MNSRKKGINNQGVSRVIGCTVLLCTCTLCDFDPDQKSCFRNLISIDIRIDIKYSCHLSSKNHILNLLHCYPISQIDLKIILLDHNKNSMKQDKIQIVENLFFKG